MPTAGMGMMGMPAPGMGFYGGMPGMSPMGAGMLNPQEMMW